MATRHRRTPWPDDRGLKHPRRDEAEGEDLVLAVHDREHGDCGTDAREGVDELERRGEADLAVRARTGDVGRVGRDGPIWSAAGIAAAKVTKDSTPATRAVFRYGVIRASLLASAPLLRLTPSRRRCHRDRIPARSTPRS